MAINDPRDIPGLVAWYSAEAETGYVDGAVVTGWTDLSGNGNDAVATDSGVVWKATAGPSGGPCLQFAGQGYFTLPDVMGAATSGEIAASIRSAGGTGGSHWDFGGTGSSHYPYGANCNDNFGFTGSDRFAWAYGDLTTITTWHRLAATARADSTHEQWLNGVSKQAVAAKAVGFDPAPRVGNGNYALFTGDMACVVVYSRDLTTTERADLDAWLAANPSGGTAAPTNDNIADAIEVVIETAGGTYTHAGTIDNALATTEVGEPQATGFASGRSVWWKYTPVADGLASFNTNPTVAGSTGSVDTEMCLYTGSTMDTIVRATSDSDAGTDTRSAIVDYPVTAGVTYTIQVSAYNDAHMLYGLEVTGPATVAPSGKSVLLVTADMAHAAYTRTKAALEAGGHTVTGTTDTTAAMDSAWASGTFDVIATVRIAAGPSSAAPAVGWISGKWAAGTPILIGGTEQGVAQGELSHSGEYLGLLSSAGTYANNFVYGSVAYGGTIRVRAVHDVTAGFAEDASVTVLSGENFVVLEDALIPSYGTELGDIYVSGADEGVTLIAYPLGATINGSASEAPGSTATARAVFCGWLYAGQSDYSADGKTILGQAVDWLTAGATTPPPEPTTATLQWVDAPGSLASAAVLGWWNAGTIDPVEILGWWDGAAIQPLAGSSGGGGGEEPGDPLAGVAIGDPLMGGYYAGIIDTTQGNIIANDASQTGQRYALIVAPRSLEAALAYKTVDTAAHAAASTRWDGLTATQAMAADAAAYPAADYCAGLTPPTDDASAWYMPAMDELELIYRNLKGTTEANYPDTSHAGTFPGTSSSGGYNPSSDPNGAAYTASDPAQTTVTAFQDGGTEDLGSAGSNVIHWCATEYDATRARGTYVSGSFSGRPWSGAKTSTYPYVRPVRRLPLA